MFTENLVLNSVGKVIETDKCKYPLGYKRFYHAITRDWISNEIFRRVEPKGRTMGQYIREELCPQLDVQLVCGANYKEMSMIRDFRAQGSMELLKLMWKGPKKVPVVFGIGKLRAQIKILKQL